MHYGCFPFNRWLLKYSSVKMFAAKQFKKPAPRVCWGWPGLKRLMSIRYRQKPASGIGAHFQFNVFGIIHHSFETPGTPTSDWGNAGTFNLNTFSLLLAAKKYDLQSVFWHGLYVPFIRTCKWCLSLDIASYSRHEHIFYAIYTRSSRCILFFPA